MTDPSRPGNSGAKPSGPRHPAIEVVVTMTLLAGLVWALKPSRPAVTPAPLREISPGSACPRLIRDFTPTNVTDVPGALLAGLSNEQKDRARFRLNMEPCSCGCNRSIVGCRVLQARCDTSIRLSQKIVTEEQSGSDTAGSH